MFFDKQRIKVLLFCLVKGHPFKAMAMLFLNAVKAFPASKQVRIGNIQQIIQTQLMKGLAADILGKEGLRKPQSTIDSWTYAQLFPYLPKHSLLRGLMQHHSATGQIVIRTSLILRDQ